MIEILPLLTTKSYLKTPPTRQHSVPTGQLLQVRSHCYWHDTVVCPSISLSVAKCIVAKQYIIQQNLSEPVIRKCPLGTRFYNFKAPTLIKFPTL